MVRAKPISSSAASTPRPPVAARIACTGSAARASIGTAWWRSREREFRGIDVDRVDLGGAERARELDRGDAEPADAEDRDGVAVADARLAQRMQCGRR